MVHDHGTAVRFHGWKPRSPPMALPSTHRRGSIPCTDDRGCVSRRRLRASTHPRLHAFEKIFRGSRGNCPAPLVCGHPHYLSGFGHDPHVADPQYEAEASLAVAVPDFAPAPCGHRSTGYFPDQICATAQWRMRQPAASWVLERVAHRLDDQGDVDLGTARKCGFTASAWMRAGR